MLLSRIKELTPLLLLLLWPTAGRTDVHLRGRSLGPDDGVSVAALQDAPREGLWAASAPAIDLTLGKALSRPGIRTLSYLPDRALLLWASGTALAPLVDDGRLSFVAPLASRDRIAPELTGRSDARDVLLEVLVVPGLAPDTLSAALSRAGARVLGQGPGPSFDRLRLRLAPGWQARLDELAATPEIVWLAPLGRHELLNDASVWVGQSGLDDNGATPIFDAGIHGEGQVVAVLDTGLDYDMCYFREANNGAPPVNRLGTTADPSRRKVVAYDFIYAGDNPADPTQWDDHGHGTHVAGSVAGDDLRSPIAHDPGDGMAPAAQLVIQDGGFGGDNCADLPGLGCPVVDLTPFFDQAYAQGARIHTNSWGDRENFTPQNTYTTACLDSDAFMWDHPDFLLLYAAGNSGSGDDTVGSPSVAKNVISVGATLHGSSADTIAGFSSRGWAQDGRTKPTLTCPGVSINSALTDADIRTGNCGTARFSGTSMASPTCAGLAALARQYYVEGYYPAARPNPADAFTPSAALIKATLVNAARPMANEAVPISRAQGFGRVTLVDTLALPGGRRQLFVADERAAFQTGEVATRPFDVEVVSAAEPLKVTLVWTDPPSNPVAAINLINDLDLIVTGPDGTFLGNVLQGGVSVPGGVRDSLNVEEQVLVPNPTPGTWTLEVHARSIPWGPQGFALVATGDLPDPPGILLDGVLGWDDGLNPLCSDQDGAPDNGEAVRVLLAVRNPSPTDATGVEVRLASLVPEVTVTSLSPQRLPRVTAGASVSVPFELFIDAATCRQGVDLTATASSDQNIAPDTARYTVALEQDRQPGSLGLDFENGLIDSNGEAWSAAGGFALSSTRADRGAWSLWAGVAPAPDHCDGSGSRDGANACASLVSPLQTPTASSVLTVRTWFELEARNGGQFWDRANVHVIVDGQHTLLVPSSGRPYAGADGDNAGLCHLSGQDGWAGAARTWGTSTFDLSPWAGRDVRIELNYNTDGGEICEGIYLDEIAVTDLELRVCDALQCSCVTSGLNRFTDLRGVRSGRDAHFTWSDTASGALEQHLNSVSSRQDLTDVDPQSPRQTGQGVLRCRSAQPGCTHPGAMDDPTSLLYYQAIPACGPSGAEEGPI